jgi:hypothetical protein
MSRRTDFSQRPVCPARQATVCGSRISRSRRRHPGRLSCRIIPSSHRQSWRERSLYAAPGICRTDHRAGISGPRTCDNICHRGCLRAGSRGNEVVLRETDGHKLYSRLSLLHHGTRLGHRPPTNEASGAATQGKLT